MENNIIKVNQITVEDTEHYTVLKLLNKLIGKINELAYANGDIYDKLDYLLNDGLSQEVVKALTEWLNDGTLSDVITEEVLVGIDSRIDEINAQLSNKMNIGDEIVISQINKNKGLIDESYLTDELKQQITGTTPIHAVPADGSITSEKLADSCVHFLKTAEPLSDLIIFDSFIWSRYDSTTKNATITIQATFSTESNNLGTFVHPLKDYELADGQHLVLDYASKTISTANVNNYVTGSLKYILVTNLGGRLYSSIPIINDVINQRGKQPPLMPWDLPIVTDNSDGSKTITLKGVFVDIGEIHRYFNLPETSFVLKDAEVLYYNGRDGFEKTTWKTYDPHPYGDAVIYHLNHKLYSSIPLYQNYFSQLWYGASDRQSSLIIVDKNGLGDYGSISEAVSNANDSAEHPVTILIQPGVYKESIKIRGGRHISLVGVNKNTCIIQTDSGQYTEPPLEIQGEAYISNLTIIATHDDNLTTNVDSLRAYAVHCDYEGAGTTEFNNCLLISHQNASIGCGLHNNQTLKIVNCELISKTPTESSMTTNGSLFVHDGAGATNQKLIVKDSVIKSVNGYSMYLNGFYGTEVEATFYNNVFWSNVLKNSDESIHLDSAGNGISNNIKLTDDSFGNNVNLLNVGTIG